MFYLEVYSGINSNDFSYGKPRKKYEEIILIHNY
jgi:hypothetical protein